DLSLSLGFTLDGSEFSPSDFADLSSDGFADDLVPEASSLLFPSSGFFLSSESVAAGFAGLVFGSAGLGIDASSSSHESRFSRNGLPSISTARSITTGRLRLSSTSRNQGSVRSPAPNIGQSPRDVRS